MPKEELIEELIRKREFSEQNIEHFKNALKNTNWHDIQNIDDPDEAYKCFSHKVQRICL